MVNITKEQFSKFVFIVGSLFIGLCWGGATMLEFMYGIADYVDLIAVTIVLGLAVDVWGTRTRKKLRTELWNEYFDFEVNIKKSKNGKRK